MNEIKCCPYWIGYRSVGRATDLAVGSLKVKVALYLSLNISSKIENIYLKYS